MEASQIYRARREGTPTPNVHSVPVHGNEERRGPHGEDTYAELCKVRLPLSPVPCALYSSNSTSAATAAGAGSASV